MIFERGDKHAVRVYDQLRRRQVWVGTFDTLREAREAERDKLAEFQAPRRASLTVLEWGKVWARDYARPAPATRKTYGYAVARIARDVGHLRLTDLDRPAGRRWAASWPRQTTRVARTMWADALRDGLCEANPFAGLRLETPRGRKDLTALTEPEIAQLADLACETHEDYGQEARAIILFLAYTGIRPGELCALQWTDLEPAEREAVVARTVDGTGREKEPKNGLSRRITLPPLALAALGDVPRRVDSPYIFHTVRGHRLTKGSLSYLWRPVAKTWKAKTGRKTQLYELRHACATLLLERGLSPADVALQLGHTDGGRLVQVLYGHPDEDRARDRLRMAFADAPERSVGSSGVAQ